MKKPNKRLYNFERISMYTNQGNCNKSIDFILNKKKGRIEELNELIANNFTRMKKS